MAKFESKELNRIKAMMNYGLVNENKKSYSSVEFHKEGADGKMYGVIREGAKYYIKVSKDKKNLIKENFEYIGGFPNRKDYEYNSYANALKQFDLKMASLREAYSDGKQIMIESWNPDKMEDLKVESVENMRKEIMRQRQIMSNATLISEGKSEKVTNGNPFTEKPCCEDGECDIDKTSGKQEFDAKKGDGVNESAEPLAWHADGGSAKETIADTYMDKSHGTEIGNGAPFDDNYQPEEKNGVVEECDSMHDNDNQNCPSVGTGEIGDKAPFDGEKGKQIDEAIDDLGDSDVLDDEEGVEGDVEDDFDGDDVEDFDGEAEGEDFDDEDMTDDFEGEELEDFDGEAEGDDMEARLASIENTLSTILDKLNALNAESYDDNEDLYDEEGEDLGDEDMTDGFEGEEVEDFDGEAEGDDFDMEDEPMDDEEGDMFESRLRRGSRINEENRLDDFGKHPAYRKKPMTLPKTSDGNFEGYYDMNDDSVYSEQPYGEKIGSGAPFELSPERINNAIAESIRRILKKK